MKMNQQQQQQDDLAVEAEVCLGALHSAPLCPNSFSCKCSLQRVIGVVQGFSLCYTINTGASPGLLFISCCCPVSSRFCSFRSELQQVKTGWMLGWASSEPWIWVWVETEWASQPASYLGELSCLAQVRCGASSPTFMPSWLAHPCSVTRASCLGKVWGLLSELLQPECGGTCSQTLGGHDGVLSAFWKSSRLISTVATPDSVPTVSKGPASPMSHQHLLWFVFF